ncbi:hypothetical protein FI667_g9065, partial [Globisporangium splendens]
MFKFGETQNWPNRTKSPFQNRDATSAATFTPSPAPKTGLVDGAAEGIASFVSKPFASYRDSGELLQDEIVKPDSVIPHAALTDYAQVPRTALAIDSRFLLSSRFSIQSSGTDDFQRDLTSLSNSELQLELKLKLRVFASVRTTSYKFVLRSVSLAPLDVLAAKLRNQEEEISSLRSALEVVMVDTRARAAENELLRTEIDAMQNIQKSGEHAVLDTSRRGHAFMELLNSGKIRFRSSGLFDVFISVANNSSHNGDTSQLRKNGTVLQTCKDSNANGHCHTSIMRHIVPVAINDDIEVVFLGNNVAFEGNRFIAFESAAARFQRTCFELVLLRTHTCELGFLASNANRELVDLIEFHLTERFSYGSHVR